MRLIDADTLAAELKMVIENNVLPRIITDQFVPFVQAIKMLPTIEAEPIRRGRWVIEPGIGCKCSACGFDIGNDLDFMEYVSYCPNCGARMEEQE